jgi:nicotinamidase/pyrazinamidase
VESIELIGLCTDICVISNAMICRSAFLELPVMVDAACCAGVSPESHERALLAMATCQIDII